MLSYIAAYTSNAVLSYFRHFAELLYYWYIKFVLVLCEYSKFRIESNS